jgi:crotonobetainyl-CoA:carnitine CoA-transferase CaiB-like acyl-CoA transferase
MSAGGMLSAYRVLDLTTERGLLCGQILGDLGADVIHVEPPGGSSARRIGPFVGDEPHPDRSLFWWAFSRNKRSVTLNLTSAAGRAMLRRLVEGAHFLLESDTPGRLAGLGLGYDDLAAVNPALVYVSITPFGQSGPKAGYADSDLVMMAAGGPLLLTGDDDRPPVRVSVPQAYLHASAEAAAAAMIAHHERQRSGRGQHVDVSAQQAVAAATQSGILSSAVGFFDLKRLSGGARFGPFTVRFNYPARDGFVSITHGFGSSFGSFTRRLMEYVYEAGFCDEATRDKDWVGYVEQLLSGQEPIEEFERVKQVIESCTRTKTKAELFEAAQQRGLLVAPIATLAEVAKSPQLRERGYWWDLEHPELGRTVRYPGPFARFSRAPITYRRRPPTVGEHNAEVFASELGCTPTELEGLSAQGII